MLLCVVCYPQSRLREIFLKTDNLIGGRYLAEVTQQVRRVLTPPHAAVTHDPPLTPTHPHACLQVLSDLDASKYQLAEWRVSIYGRKPSEWDKLARWFYTYKLASDKIRWLIQVPTRWPRT